MADLQTVPKTPLRESDSSISASGGLSDGVAPLDPKELIASFDEIVNEFAAELKEIEAQGVKEASGGFYRDHETFLQDNWVPSPKNIKALLLPHIKSQNFKELVPALKFIIVHTIDFKLLKARALAFVEFTKTKVIPRLAYVPSTVMGGVKSYFQVRDKKVWIKRAKTDGVYLLGALVGILLFVRYLTYEPVETYEDVEDQLTTIEEPDLGDGKRMVEHFLELPTVLATLKPGRTDMRLLEFDVVVELDSLVSLVENQDPFVIAEIKNRLSDFVARYRYEDLNTPDKKSKLKKDLIYYLQRIIPTGRIFNVYFPKWVFSPLELRHIGR